MGVWVLGFPTLKIYVGIHGRIRTARRKVASTEQFIKAEVHSQGERAGRFPEVEPAQGCLWIGYLFLLWMGRNCNGHTVRWYLMETPSSHWGNPSSHTLGGGVFDPTWFVQEPARQSFSLVGGCGSHNANRLQLV